MSLDSTNLIDYPKLAQTAQSGYVPSAPINPPSGFTQWAASQTPTDASVGGGFDYASIINRLLNQQRANSLAFPDFVGPTASAAQRAAMLVNGKYTAQQAVLDRSSQKNDQNLQVGTATQNNYGAIGDAKLKDIYSGLTDIANQTATKTTNLYNAAQAGVQGSYDSAQATQDAVAAKTQGDVANTANQLGLQTAVADATKNLTNYQDAAKSQLAASKAAGVSNIITLGANMGAAALKDVNIMAQLGADSRRDLVNSVQNTISTLQFQHDQTSADLQSQMQSLEAQRQNDLQAATYQYEADDAQKRFEYAQSKAKFDADQQQNDILNQHNNLQEVLSLLKQQNDDLSTNATIDNLNKTQELNSKRLDWEMSQQDFVNQLDVGKFNLNADKVYADIADAKTDNALAATKAAEDARHNAALENINATKYATDAQRLAAVAAETARHNGVSEAQKAQDLVIKQQTATTAADKLKADAVKNAKADARNATLDASLIAKREADIKAAEARAASYSNTTKFPGGIDGMQQAAKAGKIDSQAVSDANTLIAKVTQDPATAVLKTDPYLAAQAAFYALPGIDPANLKPNEADVLVALAIYYKKR